ncbi:4-oxalocrotonate tautomerase family protein [Actinoplanes sp. NPDC020271]|uniref:4-oxalocrotonate tautomerase family protein n=1 Tax=Actinoplanes sp. NPDC020271 TaxID=3363896 RepID=UPI0037A60E3B
MPHVTLYALEAELAGRESGLISGLTDAVVSVYGEWARSSVDVRLIGIPAGRWARGGVAVDSVAPSVTFGMREEVFARDDADTVVARLVSALTAAVTAVFGDDCRDEVLVELVGQPTSRSGLGGQVISGTSPRDQRRPRSSSSGTAAQPRPRLLGRG